MSEVERKRREAAIQAAEKLVRDFKFLKPPQVKGVGVKSRHKGKPRRRQR